MPRKIQYLIYAALIVLAAALWSALSAIGLLDDAENEALRWRYLFRGEQPATTRVVFVNIDPLTLVKIGARPWDRLNFAQAFEALLGPGKARAVGVDMIFSQLATGSLLDAERARYGDGRLGEVVQRYTDRLVLGAAYTGTTKDGIGLPLRRYGFTEPAEVPFPEAPTFPIVKSATARLGLVNLDEALAPGKVPYNVPAIIETEGERFSNSLINGQLYYFDAILNDPKRMSEDGFFRIVDADGFALDPIPMLSSHRLFTLGLAVFLAAHDLGPEAVEWTPEALLIRQEGRVLREVPLLNGQTLEVNWLQGWGNIPLDNFYSMVEVLEKAHALGNAASQADAAAVAELEQWFERFNDAIIFIGGTDATLMDHAPTPFDTTPVPKVGFHANIYRTLEEEAYIKDLRDSTLQVIVFTLSILVAGLMLWSGRGRVFTRSASVLLLVAYAGCVFYAFSRSGIILPLIAPVGAAVTASLGVVLFKLGAEEGQRRRIKNLFGAYVSPSLVQEMVDSQRDPELGGTEVAITALFSDVAGFSEISESLKPSDLVALMNEYLGAMTETFQQEQGTLDKYIGDAIVTMFGMPYPVEDHAARACRSAIRMQERHAALREAWAKTGKWPENVLTMRTRIGINTGQAVIGNMGSVMRFNYTMMGDSVNLAARCESGAKTYGVYIMITEDTLHTALQYDGQLNYRQLDCIVVKGRSQPVNIYELWDGTVDADLMQACKTSYENALQCYLLGDWARALAAFESCLELEPARAYAPTTPSQVMAARCREFLQHGAPEPWDGVYRMTSK